MYVERELTAPVDLCDARGRLNPAAVGWSRPPLVRANLRGHWPRKKRWNFWNWIGPRLRVLGDARRHRLRRVLPFDVHRLRDGAHSSGACVRPPRPLRAARARRAHVAFAAAGSTTQRQRGRRHRGRASAARDERRATVAADFVVRRPPGHESLNIVVPWTRRASSSTRSTTRCRARARSASASARYVMDPRELPRRAGLRAAASGPIARSGTGASRPACQDGVLRRRQRRRQVDDRHRRQRERAPARRSPPQDHGGSRWDVRPERLDGSPGACARRTRARSTSTLEPVVAHRRALNLGVLAHAAACAASAAGSGTIRADGRELADRRPRRLGGRVRPPLVASTPPASSCGPARRRSRRPGLA